MRKTFENDRVEDAWYRFYVSGNPYLAQEWIQEQEKAQQNIVEREL